MNNKINAHDIIKLKAKQNFEITQKRTKILPYYDNLWAYVLYEGFYVLEKQNCGKSRVQICT